MRLATLALAAFALLGQQRPPAGDDFSAAKALYASGAYEDALTKLSAVPAEGGAVDTANEYRALCYLALGRTSDAEHQIDELVTRNPLFKMSDSEVPPRLVAMYHESRKKLLPGLVREAYLRAKTSFEQKSYPMAQSQLKDVLQILGDDDLAEDVSGTADIKLFADGFLKLAEMEIAGAQKAAADAAAVAAATNKPPPPPPPPDPIYSLADKDVTPPVEISRKMPTWNPPDQASQRMEFRGVLRVLLDKKGVVESASVAQAIAPTYDPVLVEAAKQWTFKPATKDGQPVKYLLLIQVVLSPK